MKIYSWNVLRSNKKVEELCAFIESLDFDVLCLQEVTTEMLERFKKMPYRIAYNIERYSQVMKLSTKAPIITNYAVILTPHEIISEKKIQFPKLLTTFTTNVFSVLLESVQKWESITNLGSIYADIKINGKNIRVFCTHLALWNPQTRAKEFEHVMEYMPEEGEAIICGDFNILEFGPIKILNWMFGGSFAEGMPWYPERKYFEGRFAKRALLNPLRGFITHKFSRSQLDHILVSAGTVVKNAWVVPDAHGSDHQPVGIEIVLA
jgi:endonuclease/exonuclease/phosphatase family metal-dependent hydrolase